MVSLCVINTVSQLECLKFFHRSCHPVRRVVAGMFGRIEVDRLNLLLKISGGSLIGNSFHSLCGYVIWQAVTLFC